MTNDDARMTLFGAGLPTPPISLPQDLPIETCGRGQWLGRETGQNTEATTQNDEARMTNARRRGNDKLPIKENCHDAYTA
jgi:hypothetical protein